MRASARRADGSPCAPRTSTTATWESFRVTAPEQEIIVEYSEFARNGHENGKAHNLYIGSIRRFELRFSSSHGARIGHLVKSRAKQNLIAYNRLADLPAGPASYELDFPRSTDATVIGNLILQSAASPNGAMLSYGAEDRAASAGRPASRRVEHLREPARPPAFRRQPFDRDALVIGNVFGGGGGQDGSRPGRGRGQSRPSRSAPSSIRGAMNFALRGEPSPAPVPHPDAAARPTDLVPQFEYVHPVAARARGAGQSRPARRLRRPAARRASRWHARPRTPRRRGTRRCSSRTSMPSACWGCCGRWDGRATRRTATRAWRTRSACTRDSTGSRFARRPTKTRDSLTGFGTTCARTASARWFLPRPRCSRCATVSRSSGRGCRCCRQRRSCIAASRNAMCSRASPRRRRTPPFVATCLRRWSTKPARPRPPRISRRSMRPTG